MLWLTILFAFVLALLLSGVLAGPMGWRHPASDTFGAAMFFVFVVLFLAMWAGGVWLVPAPYPGGGVLMVLGAPLLTIGVLVMLLLAAASPAPRRRVVPRPEAAREAEALGAVFGVLFWMLLLGLLALALLGLWR